jgi:hypothetical protein
MGPFIRRLVFATALAGILFPCLAENSFAQGVCGGYAVTVQGCRRIAVLPWYVAQPGVWETEIHADAASANEVKFGYLPAFALTYNGAQNLLLTDAVTIFRR